MTTPTNPTLAGNPASNPSGTGGRNPIVAAALLLLMLVAAPACGLIGGGGDELGSGTVVNSTGAEPDGGEDALLGAPWVQASSRAVADGASLTVFDEPAGAPVLTLNPRTSFGTPRVLLVEEERDGWVKVRLPMRPNHRAGWVPADRVEIEPLALEVQVDLSTRQLTVRSGNQTVLDTPVAIGTTTSPTPTGTFFITDKLSTPDPAGAYGPYALGLSGYSDVLTEFGGGDGQIGIHGTNDPSSIGRDVSHGCIRVPNEIVSQLAELLPLGTPVHVV